MMGVGGISVSSLLIILVIVLVLFGGKRLRGLGDDLGGAIKGFRSAVKEEQKSESVEEIIAQSSVTDETVSRSPTSANNE